MFSNFLTIIAAVMLLCSPCIAGDLAGGYVSRADIVAVQQRLLDNDKVTKLAYAELIKKADARLNHRPRAMKVFNVPGFYGEQRAEHTRLKNLLSDNSAAAFHLALAALLTDDTQKKQLYAKQASAILDNWATTNDDVAGADGKLVLCYNGTAFVFAADALELGDHWPAESKARFQKWVRNVLLPASKIKQRDNNWACWGIMAAMASHRFLNDATGFEADVNRLREIIDHQIEPDGSMPHEIKRGKRSLWYTYFALAPLTVAVDLARKNGHDDLFQYDPPSGGTIQQAISFFYERGIKDPKRWPVKINETIDRSGKYATLLLTMGRVYQNETWQQFAIHPAWRDKGGLAWICPSLLHAAPCGSQP